VFTGSESILVHLLPFLEQGALAEYVAANQPNWFQHKVSLFLCPLDPSASDGLSVGGYGASNITGNWQVFGWGNHDISTALAGVSAPEFKLKMMDGQRSFGRSFPDGTSNTLLFATRYARCFEIYSDTTPSGSTWGSTRFWNINSLNSWAPLFGVGNDEWSATPANFIPSPAGVGVTFQVAPSPPACRASYAQALTRAGLQAALADGSVRTISPLVSALTWRNALIPDDGNPLGTDWEP
jgi:hypothetical protein